MLPSNKIINKKVKEISRKLGISDYSFYIDLVSSKKIKDLDCENYATVSVHEDVREVCISLNKKLAVRKPDEIDKTLVHELLHVRFSELSILLRLILKSYVKDEKVRKMYKEQFDQLEHKIIIPITDALVEKWQNQS